MLIVEDNAANMTLAVFLLESAGHTVLSATDAEAGLTLARDEQPDLILMDIQLPGMDGLEATDAAQRRGGCPQPLDHGVALRDRDSGRLVRPSLSTARECSSGGRRPPPRLVLWRNWLCLSPLP